MNNSLAKLRKPEFDSFFTRNKYNELINEKFVIVKPFGTCLINKNIDWYMNPFDNSGWLLNFHSLTWLFSIEYGIRNDTKRSKELKELLFNLIDSYLDLTLLDKNEPEYCWYDHSTSWRSSVFAYFYLTYYDEIEKNNLLKKLELSMKKHAVIIKQYLSSGKWKGSNHTIFMTEGLHDLVLTSVFDNNIADNYRYIIIKQMKELVTDMFCMEEGISTEQSLFYHFYGLSLIVESNDYFSKSDIHFIDNIDSFLKKAIDYYYIMIGESKVLPPIGDTFVDMDLKGHPALKYSREVIEESIATSNIMQEYQKMLSDYNPLNYIDNFYAFPETGFYILDGLIDKNYFLRYHFIFREQKERTHHGHFDGNSFLLNINGIEFFSEAGGPYAYHDKEVRFGYIMAAEAHNVLIFDKTSEKYTTHVLNKGFTKDIKWIIAEAKGLKNATWIRVIIDDGNNIIILDKFSKPNTKQVDLLFHLSQDTKSKVLNDNNILLINNDVRINMEYFSSATVSLNIINDKHDEFPKNYITKKSAELEHAPLINLTAVDQEGWFCTVIGNQEKNSFDVLEQNNDGLFAFNLNNKSFSIDMNTLFFDIK